MRLTADGRLAVIHDGSTARTTGTDLGVERTEWKDLAALDAGSLKGEAFRGESIPLLEDLLDRWGPEVLWDIEVKNGVAADYGLEAALARTLRATRWGPALLDSCAVTSFNPLALARFRALVPEVAVGIIWSRDPELPFVLRHGEGRWLGRADFLKPAAALVGPRSAFRWRHLEGYEYFPWTVDEGEEAERFLALGASGLVSNRADRLAPALAG